MNLKQSTEKAKRHTRNWKNEKKEVRKKDDV